MRFSLLSTAIAATLSSVVVAAPVARSTTLQDTVNTLAVLSEKTHKLQAPAQSITITNGPLIIIGQGPFPPILTGFTDIIKDVDTFAASYGRAVFDEAGCKTITEKYTSFVWVNQQLLNILIGKAGLFTTVPVIGDPVARVLRQLETRYDFLGFTFVDSCEGKGNVDIASNHKSLGETVAKAIESYEGLFGN
ncbi:hypothetical protein QBC32DRAFT_220086 [Pseudoneurospora amorphoporcata]|uniref:Uncharacterized protein n=1 Tax=Pseudoneurospora amorphoporcata TaxID=241081 RepID=A0AAN6NNT4_9PEZI|nr:hypothetical protein QBC32DRAFT_220086 [Pseudoneurospora amorphoporcata]